MSPCIMRRRINGINLVFFVSLLAVTCTALPWYARHIGISRAEWALFWCFVLATGLSITVGYHRLFSHRAFQASPVIRALCLVFGAAAFEQSALHWASLHRDHHRYVDTDRDPYNIKRGFWYAHIGWMTLWDHQADFSNVADLDADPLLHHQHRHYLLWALAFGVALPLAIGAATGHLLGALLLAVVGRMTLVHHSTFSINSVCHTFGRATYDITTTARDHWLVAFLTNGEGYHNFHHRFASDYRNGVRWYQWDPSKWLIWLLSRAGLAGRLHRASPQAILAARTAAEHARIASTLAPQTNPAVAALLAAVQERYVALRARLNDWERLEREYARLRQAVAAGSRETLETLKAQIAVQRRQAAKARRAWIAFIRSQPMIPRTVLA